MLKKILLILALIFMSSFSFASWQWGDETEDIYTQNQNDVINTNDVDDPLRAGTKNAVQNVEGIAKAETDTDNANQNNLIKYVSKWVNYFLGLLGIIVTILIIREGIILITTAGNDSKQKEATKNVKNYILAIIFIFLSYLLVSLIFYFINVNAK